MTYRTPDTSNLVKPFLPPASELLKQREDKLTAAYVAGVGAARDLTQLKLHKGHDWISSLEHGLLQDGNYLIVPARWLSGHDNPYLGAFRLQFYNGFMRELARSLGNLGYFTSVSGDILYVYLVDPKKETEKTE